MLFGYGLQGMEEVLDLKTRVQLMAMLTAFTPLPLVLPEVMVLTPSMMRGALPRWQ